MSKQSRFIFRCFAFYSQVFKIKFSWITTSINIIISNFDASKFWRFLNPEVINLFFFFRDKKRASAKHVYLSIFSVLCMSEASDASLFGVNPCNETFLPGSPPLYTRACIFNAALSFLRAVQQFSVSCMRELIAAVSFDSSFSHFTLPRV